MFKSSKLSYLLLSSVVTLGLTACGSNPSKEAAKADVDACYFPDTNKTELAPGWICGENKTGFDFAAKGVAAKSQAGESFMNSMAETDARRVLASRLNSEVKNQMQQFTGTTGGGASETVDNAMKSFTSVLTQATLSGSKVYRTTQSSVTGSYYVLMVIDKASADKVINDTINKTVNSSMGNDKALWQQFQASKAKDEMNAAFDKQKAGQ